MIAMTDDAELLRLYVTKRSEEAFTELVRRHVDLVYSAALRQVGGDRHRAQDVVQGVFTELARRASSLAQHRALRGWLYTCTRFTATKIVRTESRRRAREEKAHAMTEPAADDASMSANWDQLRPVLDEAMHELKESERTVVILRFFDQQSLKGVGEKLGLNEDAARKRVDRALEKLHGAIVKRGITSTAAALSLALGQQAVLAAPTGVAASTAAAALAGAGGATMGGGAAWILKLMSMTKWQVSVITAIVAVGTTTTVFRAQARAKEQARSESRTEQQKIGQTPQASWNSHEAPASSESQANELRQATTERDALRTEIAALKKVNAQPSRSTASGSGQKPKPIMRGAMVPIEVGRSAGRATPIATFQTGMWSAHQVDVDRLVEIFDFDPADRAKLAEFYSRLPAESQAEYRTPERVFAAIAASKLAENLVGSGLVSEKYDKYDEVTLTMRMKSIDGSETDDTFQLRQKADGWHMVVPTKVVDRYTRAIFKDTPTDAGPNHD
jgi:RNA polymerase sigma factor (sigma-70 family)